MKMLRLSLAAILAALALVWSPIGRASQFNNYLPTTGVFNGLTAANTINNALDALLTCHSGATAPTNALGGSPKLGQCWIDTTSATLPIKKRYTGAAWIVEGVLDVSNGIWLPPIGGGSATLASATTTNLCTSPQSLLTISGTTTITGFGSSCVVGQFKTLVFSGVLTLTYNATSLIIPGAASKTTAAGDIALVVYLGGGNWRVLDYVAFTGATVLSIDARTGNFTTGNGLDSTGGNVIELTAARRTLPYTCVIYSTSATTCVGGGVEANNGTYTTPANALWLEVEMCGGGSGGWGSGAAGATAGAAGTATTFGSSLLTANGGATSGSQTAGAVGGTATGGNPNRTGASGGDGSASTSPNPGGKGGSSPFGAEGSGGVAGAGAGKAALANSCSGGGGGGANTTPNSGGGGASGGYLRTIIPSPSATYSFANGSGGTAGSAGTGGATGGNGGSGLIFVTPHFGS